MMTQLSRIPAPTDRIGTRPLTLEQGRLAFYRHLEGQNKSAQTIRAYSADISKFIAWLKEALGLDSPDQVEKADIGEYLSYLSHLGLSGASRARKLAALRE